MRLAISGVALRPVLGEPASSRDDVVFDFFPTDTKDLPSLVLEEVLLIKLTPGDFYFGDF